MKWSLGSQPVGGSYSARVPRSSVEVSRAFVLHILEDEVDVQQEGQGDKRDDGEEGEEVNGDVEEIRSNIQRDDTRNMRVKMG